MGDNRMIQDYAELKWLELEKKSSYEYTTNLPWQNNGLGNSSQKMSSSNDDKIRKIRDLNEHYENATDR